MAGAALVVPSVSHAQGNCAPISALEVTPADDAQGVARVRAALAERRASERLALMVSPSDVHRARAACTDVGVDVDIVGDETLDVGDLVMRHGEASVRATTDVALDAIAAALRGR